MTKALDVKAWYGQKKAQILNIKKFRRPRKGRQKRFTLYKHLAGWFIIV
jgi:hypothetical protein